MKIDGRAVTVNDEAHRLVWSVFTPAGGTFYVLAGTEDEQAIMRAMESESVVTVSNGSLEVRAIVVRATEVGSHMRFDFDAVVEDPE